jgi:hypothetical protein
MDFFLPRCNAHKRLQALRKIPLYGANTVDVPRQEREKSPKILNRAYLRDRKNLQSGYSTVSGHIINYIFSKEDGLLATEPPPCSGVLGVPRWAKRHSQPHCRALSGAHGIFNRLELELELIQTQMAQKQMLRAEVSGEHDNFLSPGWPREVAKRPCGFMGVVFDLKFLAGCYNHYIFRSPVIVLVECAIKPVLVRAPAVPGLEYF